MKTIAVLLLLVSCAEDKYKNKVFGIYVNNTLYFCGKLSIPENSRHPAILESCISSKNFNKLDKIINPTNYFIVTDPNSVNKI